MEQQILLNYEKNYSKYTNRSDARVLRYDSETRNNYLCKVHGNHKEELEVELNDGSGKVKLYTSQKYNNNFREALPQLATIVETEGDCQFNVGDVIITYHFAFVNYERVAHPFKCTEEGELLFKVPELEVIAKICDSGELEPREGIIIAKPMYAKLIDTVLELGVDNIDYRRDLVKILKVWKGCMLDINEKEDYLILDDGGDYIFKHNRTDYIAVDFNLDSALAITNNPNWRDKELKKHMKDHNDLGYDN